MFPPRQNMNGNKQAKQQQIQTEAKRFDLGLSNRLDDQAMSLSRPSKPGKHFNDYQNARQQRAANSLINNHSPTNQVRGFGGLTLEESQTQAAEEQYSRPVPLSDKILAVDNNAQMRVTGLTDAGNNHNNSKPAFFDQPKTSVHHTGHLDADLLARGDDLRDSAANLDEAKNIGIFDHDKRSQLEKSPRLSQAYLDSHKNPYYTESNGLRPSHSKSQLKTLEGSRSKKKLELSPSRKYLEQSQDVAQNKQLPEQRVQQQNFTNKRASVSPRITTIPDKPILKQDEAKKQRAPQKTLNLIQKTLRASKEEDRVGDETQMLSKNGVEPPLLVDSHQQQSILPVDKLKSDLLKKNQQTHKSNQIVNVSLVNNQTQPEKFSTSAPKKALNGLPPTQKQSNHRPRNSIDSEQTQKPLKDVKNVSKPQLSQKKAQNSNLLAQDQINVMPTSTATKPLQETNKKVRQVERQGSNKILPNTITTDSNALQNLGSSNSLIESSIELQDQDQSQLQLLVKIGEPKSEEKDFFNLDSNQNTSLKKVKSSQPQLGMSSSGRSSILKQATFAQKSDKKTLKLQRSMTGKALSIQSHNSKDDLLSAPSKPKRNSNSRRESYLNTGSIDAYTQNLLQQNKLLSQQVNEVTEVTEKDEASDEENLNENVAYSRPKKWYDKEATMVDEQELLPEAIQIGANLRRKSTSIFRPQQDKDPLYDTQLRQESNQLSTEMIDKKISKGFKKTVKELYEKKKKCFDGMEAWFEGDADYHQVVQAPWNKNQIITLQFPKYTARTYSDQIVTGNFDRHDTNYAKEEFLNLKVNLKEDTKSRDKDIGLHLIEPNVLQIEKANDVENENFDSNTDRFCIVSLWTIESGVSLNCNKSIKIENPFVFKNGQINGFSSFRLHSLLHGDSQDLFMFSNTKKAGAKLVRFTKIKDEDEMKSETFKVDFDSVNALEFFKSKKMISDKFNDQFDKLFVQRPPALVDNGRTLIFTGTNGGDISLYESRLNKRSNAFDSQSEIVRNAEMFLGIDYHDDFLYFLTNLSFQHAEHGQLDQMNRRMLSPLLVGKIKRQHLESGIIRSIDAEKKWKLDGQETHLDFLRTKSLDYPICLPWMHSDREPLKLDQLTLEFLGCSYYAPASITFKLSDELKYSVGQTGIRNNPKNASLVSKIIQGRVSNKQDSQRDFAFEQKYSFQGLNIHQLADFRYQKANERGQTGWVKVKNGDSSWESELFSVRELDKVLEGQKGSGLFENYGEIEIQENAQSRQQARIEHYENEQDALLINFEFKFKRHQNLQGKFSGISVDGPTMTKLLGKVIIIDTRDTKSKVKKQGVVLQRKTDLSVEIEVGKKPLRFSVKASGSNQLTIQDQEDNKYKVESFKVETRGDMARNYSLLSQNVIQVMKARNDRTENQDLKLKVVSIKQFGSKGLDKINNFIDQQIQVSEMRIDARYQDNFSLDLSKYPAISANYSPQSLQKSVLAVIENEDVKSTLILMALRSKECTTSCLVMVDGKMTEEQQGLENSYFDSDRLVTPIVNYPLYAQIGMRPDRKEILIRQINAKNPKTVSIILTNQRIVNFVQHQSQSQKIYSDDLNPITDQDQKLFDTDKAEIVALVQNLKTKAYSLIKLQLDQFKERENERDVKVSQLSGLVKLPDCDFQRLRNLHLLLQQGPKKINYAFLVIQTDSAIYTSSIHPKSPILENHTLIQGADLMKVAPDERFEMVQLNLVRSYEDADSVYFATQDPEGISSQILQIMIDVDKEPVNVSSNEVYSIQQGKIKYLIQSQHDCNDLLILDENNEIVTLTGKEEGRLKIKPYSKIDLKNLSQLEDLLPENVIAWDHFYLSQRAIQIQNYAFTFEGDLVWSLEKKDMVKNLKSLSTIDDGQRLRTSVFQFPINSIKSLTRVERDIQGAYRLRILPEIGSTEVQIIPVERRKNAQDFKFHFTAGQTILASIKNEPYLIQYDKDGMLLDWGKEQNFHELKQKLFTFSALKKLRETSNLSSLGAKNYNNLYQSKKKDIENGFGDLTLVSESLFNQQYFNGNDIRIKLFLFKSTGQQRAYLVSDYDNLNLKKSERQKQKFIPKGQFDFDIIKHTRDELLSSQTQRRITKQFKKHPRLELNQNFQITGESITEEISMKLSKNGNIYNLIIVEVERDSISSDCCYDNLQEGTNQFYMGVRRDHISMYPTEWINQEDQQLSGQNIQMLLENQEQDLQNVTTIILFKKKDSYKKIHFNFVGDQLLFNIGNCIWAIDSLKLDLSDTNEFFQPNQDTKKMIDWNFQKIKSFNVSQLQDRGDLQMRIYELSGDSVIRNRSEIQNPNNILIQVQVNHMQTVVFEIDGEKLNEIISCDNLNDLNDPQAWVNTGLRMKNPGKQEIHYCQNLEMIYAEIKSKNGDQSGDNVLYKTYDLVDLMAIKSLQEQVQENKKIINFDFMNSLFALIDTRSIFSICKYQTQIYEAVQVKLDYLAERQELSGQGGGNASAFMANNSLQTTLDRMRWLLIMVETSSRSLRGLNILQYSINPLLVDEINDFDEEGQEKFRDIVSVRGKEQLFQIALKCEDLTINDFMDKEGKNISNLPKGVKQAVSSEIFLKFIRSIHTNSFEELEFPIGEKSVAIGSKSSILTKEEIEQFIKDKVDRKVGCCSKSDFEETEVQVKILPLNWLYGTKVKNGVRITTNNERGFLDLIDQNPSLVNSEVVSAIFYHLWAEYKNALQYFVVLSYIFFFFSTSTYMMVLMEGNRENLQAKSTKEYFPYFHVTIELCYLIPLIFHLFFELTQIFTDGPRNYFKIFINKIDFFIIVLHLFVYAMRNYLLFLTIDEEIPLFEFGSQYTVNFKFLRQLSGILLVVMAYKLTILLSVLGDIAFYVALISKTLTEMIQFVVIMFLYIFSISTLTYMLSKNRRLYHEPDLMPAEWYAPVDKGESLLPELGFFVDILFYQYTTVIGNADMFDMSQDAFMIKAMYVMETFFITVTFLNMLISIMSDVFAQEQQEKENNSVKVKLMMLQEYVIQLNKLRPIFNCFRKKGDNSLHFEPSTPKFLFLITKNSDSNEDWDGQINMIRRMIDESTQKVENIVVNKVKKPLQELTVNTQTKIDDLTKRVDKKIIVLREKIVDVQNMARSQLDKQDKLDDKLSFASHDQLQQVRKLLENLGVSMEENEKVTKIIQNAVQANVNVPKKLEAVKSILNHIKSRV